MKISTPSTEIFQYKFWKKKKKKKRRKKNDIYQTESLQNILLVGTRNRVIQSKIMSYYFLGFPAYGWLRWMDGGSDGWVGE